VFYSDCFSSPFKENRMNSRIRRGQDFWRQAIERQAVSGFSAAAFCRQQGLSAQSFYKWRRKLARMPMHAADQADLNGAFASAQPSAQRLIPVAIAPSRAVDSGAPSRSSTLTRSSVSPRSSGPSRSSASSSFRQPLIEIILEGGTMVRCHGLLPADQLGELVTAVQTAALIAAEGGDA
jgi:transposase-like protein